MSPPAAGQAAFESADAGALADSLQPGAALAFLLVEHYWAAPLFDAIAEAGGMLIGEGFLNAEAGLVGAEVGRPLGEGYISANIPAGNSASRCSVKNANTLPAGINSRHISHTSGPAGSLARSPCIPPTLTHRLPRRNRTNKIFSDLRPHRK
jgi:hypothetical protein